MPFLCFTPAIQNPGKQMKERSEFLANGIDKTVKLLSSAPSFPQGLLQEALIKNAEKSVGSYWWSENTTSLIYTDSSTTSRQSPVLKLNLYLPLLPFPAPDTAIAMPRTKAVRYWTRVLIKCAGTASAQVTTQTFALQPVCCVSYGHSSLSSCPNIFKKGTALLQSHCNFQGMNPNTLQELNGSRRLWMSSHQFSGFPSQLGCVMLLYPHYLTVKSQALFATFWLFFLLYWEEGFANNSHLLV